MTSPFGTPPSGDPSGSLPPPPPSGPTPSGPPPPPPSRPITEEVPVTPGPASGPPALDDPADTPSGKGRGSTQVVDQPLRGWSPPNPLEPAAKPTDGGGATPPWWVIAAVIGGAVVACYVVWLLTNTWLRNAQPDGRGYWVPATALGVAGGLWGLLSGGADAPKRAGFGLAAGAIAGVVGSFLLGSGTRHSDAFGDTVTSGASLLRALAWGAFTAVAWAATLGASTTRKRMAQVGVGAAAGGFATGAAMGLLAGTNYFGSSARFVPTDLWFSAPIRDADAEVTVLPLLIVAIGIPVALAAINRPNVTLAGRPVLVAALASLLVPILGGVAGYTSDLDSARRDGLVAAGPAPTVPDITLPDVTLTDMTLPDMGVPTVPGSSDPTVPESTVPESSESSEPMVTEPAGTAAPAPGVATAPGSDGPTSTATTVTTEATEPVGTQPAASGPIDSQPADSTPVDSGPADSTPIDSEPADSTPIDSEPTDSTPTDSTPVDTSADGPSPADTVAVPFDAGIPFAVAYNGVATNDNGQTADVLIAVGRAAPPAQADEIWNGPSTCAADGDAVIPFIIQITSTDAAVTYVDVRFSQGAVDADAAADHPMVIEFHDPDGTTRCADATGAETANTPAFTAWPAQTPEAAGYAYGYFVVRDFFDGETAVGEAAAVVSVVPIVNQVVTSTVATIEGVAPIEFTDPVSGEPAMALDLVP